MPAVRVDHRDEVTALLLDWAANQETLGVTDASMARQLGVSKSTFCFIRKGTRRASDEVETGLARVLFDKSIDKLRAAAHERFAEAAQKQVRARESLRRATGAGFERS